MKKILLAFVALCFFGKGFADEGMWLPFLIGKNIDSMQAEGCQLTAKDIYNVNHASLKDAVPIFGGGCTGEMISPEGLLITNHRCGYASIAVLSTVEHNYLKNGFWAKDKKEELPVKGLSVRFLIRMQDVTAEIQGAASKRSKKRREKAMKQVISKIEAKASDSGKYIATVKPFFAGNQYILMVYQKFTDIRLVAAPPKGLGKFGGNTDNWNWPRHTCDFSVFRVYADSANQPADYSPTNVPYHPKKYLTISLKGFINNSFSMIMGYPGRTHRYETSYGVKMALDITEPAIVKIRDLRLSIMRKYMKQDETVKLKLASEYASIANYWKYYIGQQEQLKRLHVVSEKQKQEIAFTKWASGNRPAWSDLISDFAKCYADYRPYALQNIYFSEAFGASKLAHIAAAAHSLYKTLSERHPRQEEIAKGVRRLKTARQRYMKTFLPRVEREMFAKMTALYYDNVPKSQLPSIYQEVIFRQFKHDTLSDCFQDFTNYTFSHTFLLDNIRFADFCNHPTLSALKADPAVAYAMSFVNNYDNNCLQKVAAFRNKKETLERQYQAGLMAMYPQKLFYPDANGSMRVTYGKVAGYSPQDGVYYDNHTTLKGLLAKYIPGDDEFGLPEDFLRLAKKHDFGPYANANGGLTTCFITNNDITGGNSGSPVLNAKGELIGLAFDGNWEAMSGDIAFDKQYKRTICVDIRFVLWVMDYYGHAKNLIAEMTFDR